MRNNLSWPQIAVQSSHASIETARKFDSNLIHPSVIIFGIKNEEKLKKVLIVIENKGLICYPFYEEDGSLTSFSTSPVFNETREVFKKYQLLKFNGGNVL